MELTVFLFWQRKREMGRGRNEERREKTEDGGSRYT